MSYQPRDAAGQFARHHLGVAGVHLGSHLALLDNRSIDLKGSTVAQEVIAREDCIVFDPDLGFDRKLFAGQQVPPDLVNAYRQHGQAAPEPESPSKAPAKSAA